MATPLSRLNAADGMATPLAQAEYEKMYKTLGGKPVKKLLATHWARLVELMYAAERLLELAQDPEDYFDRTSGPSPLRRPKRAWGLSKQCAEFLRTIIRPTKTGS